MTWLDCPARRRSGRPGSCESRSLFAREAQKIVSANLTAERTWSLWPFGSPVQVIELSASTGDAPGEVDLVWDSVRGAEGYEAQCCDDFAGDGPWVQCAVASESRVTVRVSSPAAVIGSESARSAGKAKATGAILSPNTPANAQPFRLNISRAASLLPPGIL